MRQYIGMLPPAITLLTSDHDAQQCARMMASTDPWLRFGRTYDQCLATVRKPDGEVWVARHDGEIRGFIITVATGALVGYIRVVCVDAGSRSSGIGAHLIADAEQRLFREFPNVFLFVSSSNRRARALYERLGYHLVAPIDDYLVRGESELLMRKSIGPLSEFHPPPPAPRRT